VSDKNEKSGGGFLGFIKSAFVEEVPEGQAQPKAAKARESQAPMPPPGSASVAPRPAQAAVAADPAAMAKLEAMLQAALPPVYSTWMEKYTQLAEVIPDESMRFKAALKTSNATPVQLSGAVDQLINTMDKAQEEFLRGFQAQTSKVESAAKEAIASTESLLQSRESQLRAIEDEIVSLKSKLALDTSHLQEEQHRLDSIRMGFEAAHAQVVGRLNDQKSHIDALAKG
jgi:hypothetical protein